nr:IgGFc-binding protein-like [Lytechinus pictus]
MSVGYINECAGDPCANGGICIDKLAAYECNCTVGWEGENCEIDINECASIPCLNGDTSPCAEDPCMNGGTCVGLSTAVYKCNCIAGYVGENCEVDVNECFSDPCLNGGTCNDLVDMYQCECVIGFAGVNCEEDDRPQLEIVRIWSDAITVYWTVLIEVEWFRFEYRKANGSEWITSDLMGGERRLYSLIDLESETIYELQLVMRRAVGGSVATTVPITVVTCQRGFSGENCSQDATDLPFNIQIQTARTNSLTVTWDADFTPPTNNRIQLQYRRYGTTTWIPGPRVVDVSQGIADIPSLIGNEYYEVRIYVGDLDIQLFNYTLVNRFYTCEPNRIGPNCENEYRICTIWGDPHYITFDQVSYNYQGDCEYTLVTDDCMASENPATLPSFHLWSDNVKRLPSDRVAFLREIGLELDGTLFTVERDHVLRIDGINVTPPLRSGQVFIFYTGSHTIIATDFGLRVKYDGEFRAEITLPDTYKNITCGLCGTYDGLQDNEYTKENGLVVTSAREFANSWTRSDCDIPLQDDTPCLDDGTRTQAEELCSVLIDESGVLGDCFGVVDPAMYYDACVYDLCFTLPEDDLLCADVDSYASACREAGGVPGNWRAELTQCEVTCPVNSTFQTCASGCQPACYDMNLQANCPVSCVEACVCDEGLVLDDPGRCVVRGDPHYRTFDRHRYNFQGDCEYTLIRPCNNNNSSLEDFHLWGNNRKNSPSDRVSYLRGFTLEYNGTLYRVESGNKVFFNGRRLLGSLFSYGNDVRIQWDSEYLYLVTSFGLQVVYDGKHTADIDLSYDYWTKTCGLCGTFDGDDGNEYRRQDGSQTPYLTVFTQDWVVDPATCNGESPEPPVCEGDTYEDALDLCYIFSYIDSPLSECFDYVSPRDIYEDCVYDSCALGPDFDICDYIQEYALICMDEGIDLGDWRSEVSECAITCTGGKVYQTGASACQPTCGFQPSGPCTRPSYDRCVCPDGLVEDGDRCVDPNECGCDFFYGGENIHMESRSEWISDTCDRRCTCTGITLTCSDIECGEFEECIIKGGVRDCYCFDRFTRNEDDICIRGLPNCLIIMNLAFMYIYCSLLSELIPPPLWKSLVSVS